MGIDARMYAVTSQKLTDEEILRLAHDIGVAFGHDKFFRSEPYVNIEHPEWNSPGHHNISREEKIEQDGPDWAPPKGCTLLEVHLSTRYYGPGYERGDLPLIIAIAEWLDCRLPGCTVMYGGDSSGVCAKPFGPEMRKALLDHFASPEGRDYFAKDNPFMEPSPHPKCPKCKVRMPQFSFGPANCGGFDCLGCGYKVRTTDGGRTFVEVKERDDG